MSTSIGKSHILQKKKKTTTKKKQCIENITYIRMKINKAE